MQKQGAGITPVRDPAAWRTDELPANDWMLEIPDRVHSELSAEVKCINVTVCDGWTQEVVRHSLPATRELVRDLEEQIMHGRGFVLLRGLNPEWNDTELRAAYWILGKLLGTPLSQNSYGELLCDVMDRGMPNRAAKGSGFVRGYETNAHLGFHTDRADIVGLMCVRQARSGGLSSLASSISIHDKLRETAPDLLEALYRGTNYLNVEEGGDRRIARIPVFSFEGGLVSCRYSRGHMKTAMQNGVEFSQTEIAAIGAMDAYAESNEFRLDMMLQRGDIQLINNYTILHARTEFIDHPEQHLKRCMSRLWLKSNHPRPLAQHFEPYEGIPETLPVRQGVNAQLGVLR